MEAQREVRNLAMFCHLAGFAQLLAPLGGGILATFAFWLWKRDVHELVDDQGRESLNFQISWTLYMLVTFAIWFTKVGWILLTIIGIAQLVLLCIGASKAKDGIAFRYPLTIRMIKPRGAAGTVMPAAGMAS